MQYQLEIYTYAERLPFRTVEIDGEPWFVLADVCRALEYQSKKGYYGHHAERLDDDEKRLVTRKQVVAANPPLTGEGTLGGGPTLIVISESGLFSLILRSDKPEARRFRKWVTSEVLPTIRKRGSYQTGRTSLPAFIRRANENWDRVDAGYFSVVNELFSRLYGRFEMAGYVMADRSPDGTENRPDVSVGRTFSAWLQKHHPTLMTSVSYYQHKTEQWEGPSKQYPLSVLPLYIEFVETVWIPQYAESYFKPRDAKALPYLAKILPSLERPKPGTVRKPTAKAFKKSA